MKCPLCEDELISSSINRFQYCERLAYDGQPHFAVYSNADQNKPYKNIRLYNGTYNFSYYTDTNTLYCYSNTIELDLNKKDLGIENEDDLYLIVKKFHKIKLFI